MNIDLGSPVIDNRGKKLGDVDGIVIDAGTKRAQAIIVDAGLFGQKRHIVEISAISGSDDGGIHLDAGGPTAAAESQVLDSVEVAKAQRVAPPIDFIPAGGVGGPVYAEGPAVPGEYPNDSSFFDVAPTDPPPVEVESNVDENDVILDGKTEVFSRDGASIGHVKGVSIGSFGTIESLDVTEGFLSRERATFALADITDFGSQRVRLRLTGTEADAQRS